MEKQEERKLNHFYPRERLIYFHVSCHSNFKGFHVIKLIFERERTLKLPNLLKLIRVQARFYVHSHYSTLLC